MSSDSVRKAARCGRDSEADSPAYLFGFGAQRCLARCAARTPTPEHAR